MTPSLALLFAAVSASPTPVLPQSPSPWAPGQALVTGGKVVGAELRDIDTCGTCHADVVDQWRTSAHAFASFNNPLYRVAIDRLRRDVGTTASRMCASCHDIALLTEGAMDTTDIQPEDPRAHAALTCQTCHAVKSVRPDGNGSYTLAAQSFTPPEEKDPASIAAHKAEMAPSVLRTPALCGGCHRAFLDPLTGNANAFFGMDDFTAFARSAYAGSHAERIDSVTGTDCKGCHMPKEPAVLKDAAAKNGKVSSHRFIGAHSLLAAMRGDDAQLARVQEFLKGAASIDVAAVKKADGRWAMPAETATIAPGERVFVDVVIRNLRAGHRFPSGVLDAQDTWVEFRVLDRNGAEVASDATHHLRSEVIDAQGKPLSARETNQFVTAVWNHTVPPRDARAIRYTFQAPATPSAVAFPLTIEVALKHRTRNETLRTAACADFKTDVGQRYAATGKTLSGSAANPCVEAPITVIATHRAVLNGTVPPEARATWERLYEHGLALIPSLQEYLDDARPSLEEALRLVPPSARQSRAAVQLAQAEVAARQGRVDEALTHLKAVDALVPHHPAVDRVRGDAYAEVWRWKEAARAYRACVGRSPNDLEAWKRLAVASGSAGDAKTAQWAAASGLKLQPRDPDLLRVQALALQTLNAPGDAAQRAMEAWEHWKVPDEAPRIKAKCSMNVAGCADNRNPVPLRTVKWLQQEPLGSAP